MFHLHLFVGPTFRQVRTLDQSQTDTQQAEKVKELVTETKTTNTNHYFYSLTVLSCFPKRRLCWINRYKPEQNQFTENLPVSIFLMRTAADQFDSACSFGFI